MHELSEQARRFIARVRQAPFLEKKIGIGDDSQQRAVAISDWDRPHLMRMKERHELGDWCVRERTNELPIHDVASSEFIGHLNLRFGRSDSRAVALQYLSIFDE